jgi:hypothetical protein
MNTEIDRDHRRAGNWIAFLVGAIFNVMASIDFNRLLEYVLIALIGGLTWLLFQILANRILEGE